MSNDPTILSTRNVILGAIAVLVLSALGSLWKMTRPNETGGLARNSFGTKGEGFRGLFETLESLQVPVLRELAPPSAVSDREQTMLLLLPDPGLVHQGSRYVQSLLHWVELGGRLVVVPSDQDYEPIMFGPSVASAPRNILSALAIGDELELVDPSGNAAYTETDFSERARGDTEDESDEDNASLSAPWSERSGEKRAAREVAVHFEGELSSLGAEVRALSIPADGIYSLKAANEKLISGAKARFGKDDERYLVVVIRRGEGEIVVVSDPSLLANRFIAEADNSVLATKLLSPDGRPVVFDEFYHGLAVRGNALYLFTRPGFAAVGGAIILTVGAWMWREAVFLGPPLADLGASRRGIGEYVDAMAHFFSRGRDSRRFVVREVRDGVLRQLCSQMKLPLHTADLSTIVAALARRDPARAKRLETVVAEVDATLEGPGEYPRSQFMPIIERLSACL